MLSLKAVHDSRRTRTAALSPSTRLHYNLSRAPIVGALIGSSARLTGAVTSSGGAAWAGRARLQRDGAKLPVGCQRNEERATGSSHIQRVVEDKQRDTTTLQAKKSGKPTAATKEGDVETLGTPTQVPALASLKAADHPRRALHRADSHDFEIVPLAPTLEETVILPLPSPAGNDEDEWEILAHNEERVLS